MVKSYLRYEERAVFGLVVSGDSNICYDSTGKLLLGGALEQFVVWNVKQGRCVHALSPSVSSSGAKPSVTAIIDNPTASSMVAVGYSDGSMRVWDIVKGECESTMNGHKGAITALRYEKTGSLVASGSKDTDIIVWDAVGETGLFRLHGHRDQVTDVHFLERGRRLVSCSKDTFVRIWDIDTQVCIQTVVDHRSEVWSLDVDPFERYLVTGGADAELRLYSISENENEIVDKKKKKWKVLELMGEMKRQSSDRVVTVRFDKMGNYLGCQVAGKALEFYSVRDDSEALKKAKRRKRRKREKAEKSGTEEAVNSGNPVEEVITKESEERIIAADVLKLLQVVRAKSKIRSFSFSPTQSKKDVLSTIALGLHNNSLEVYEVKNDAASRIHSIDLPGHGSDVRAAVLSADNTLLMTTSHNTVKIWNPSTSSCLRTMDSGYGLCGLFTGNKHAIVGTKSGALELFDIGSAQRIGSIEAHTGAVWSVAVLPDGSGFVSGSADNDVKFWEYSSVQDNENVAKQLTIRNVRTLRMAEDILCVRFSPDGKFLAVALLDSTVKVFFTDTLKFYLSLYGHKLPVLCMDISSDGALIASGSADKNIKIWGMDFGDCHKSLFAHSDSVMGVQFVPKTHYMFSVGKDRMLKYWDADKFELLLTLEGHHAEVWCLAISSYGDFLITASHDRSIRRWDRTDEPFFIEEEREKRMETMFESALGDSREYSSKPVNDEEGGVGLAGRTTQESVSAADSIIEALDMAEEEQKRISADSGRSSPSTCQQPNVLMRGLSPSAYVLSAVASVRPSDLEQAILMLPFPDALKLMEYLRDWCEEGTQIEVACRVTTLLLRIYHHQLIATWSSRPLLSLLLNAQHKAVKRVKDVMGYNLGGLSHVVQMLAANSNDDVLFKDDKDVSSKVSKKRKTH